MSNKTFNKLLDIALDHAGVVGIVQAFIEENRISCPEAIYQNDKVIQNAYEFIEDLCNNVGYYEYGEDE